MCLWGEIFGAPTPPTQTLNTFSKNSAKFSHFVVVTRSAAAGQRPVTRVRVRSTCVLSYMRHAMPCAVPFWFFSPLFSGNDQKIYARSQSLRYIRPAGSSQFLRNHARR